MALVLCICPLGIAPVEPWVMAVEGITLVPLGLGTGAPNAAKAGAASHKGYHHHYLAKAGTARHKAYHRR